MFSLDILCGELAQRHPQLIPSHMPHIWPLCYTNQIKLYCTLTRFWRKQILGTLWNQVEPWNCWRQNSDKNAVFTQNLLSYFSFNVSCIIPRVCLPPDIQLQPLLNCLWWLVIWTRWKRPVSILLLKRESFRECTWMALYDANRISMKKWFPWRLNSWNQG